MYFFFFKSILEQSDNEILNIEKDNHTNCRNDKIKFNKYLTNSKKGVFPTRRLVRPYE